MKKIQLLLLFSIILLFAACSDTSDDSQNQPPQEDDNTGTISDYYNQWNNGIPSDPTFFPLAVWLQSPSNADNFQNIGINTYVGLWVGPTEAQLTALKAQGIHVVGSQTSDALTSDANSVLKSWMHQDEPDNAQLISEGEYGPCILPDVLVDRYATMKTNDSTRPVLLNFGQGVSNINWSGRWYLDEEHLGVDYSGDNYSTYYTEASEAADILSYDIYPVTSPYDHIQGNLEYVAQGVKNLIEWSGGRRIVWNCIETTHINHPTLRPNGDQIRSEVWMSLISGSMGIIYFVHEWVPDFREDGIFRYDDVVDAVTDINSQITQLAPVLNSFSVKNGAQVSSTIPVEFMVKNYDDSVYVFSVAMENTSTSAFFTISGIGNGTADVIGEERQITVTDGQFQDEFEGYEVHLYRIQHQN